MQDILMYTKNAYFYYCYYGFPLSLAIAAILYLLLEKESEKKKVMAYFTSAVVVGICPVTIWLVIKVWLPMTEYWKVFYLLPIAIVLAYAATMFWGKMSGRKKQWIVSVIFVIIIGMAMHFNVSFEQLKRIENQYKMPEEIVALDEMLEQYDLQNTLVVMPEEIKGQLCSFSEGIRVADTISAEDRLVLKGEAEFVQYGTLDSKLELVRCGYASGIILDATCNNEMVMNEHGFKLLINNKDYYIYTYME